MQKIPQKDYRDNRRAQIGGYCFGRQLLEKTVT